MECGPSQAEDEHRGPPPPPEEETQEEPSFQNKNNSAGSLPSFGSVESLQEWLADDVVTEQSFVSPWGGRVPLVYADHTASNRPMQSIEMYLQNVCMPLYGNTHTNTSLTGSQRFVLVRGRRGSEEDWPIIIGKRVSLTHIIVRPIY
jgi:hypothetical protein